MEQLSSLKKQVVIISKTCMRWFRYDKSIELGDLIQEAYLKLLTALQYFDPDRASLNIFTDRVIKNHFKDLLRKGQRIPNASNSIPWHDLKNDIEEELREDITDHSNRFDPIEDLTVLEVRKAIESIPDPFRSTAIDILAGMPINSAAQQHRLSATTLRNTLKRAFKMHGLDQ